MSALSASLAPALVDPVAFLSSYTYRTMLLGTSMVGLTAGALGSYLYLHKQSLVSDVIGHSAIAGVTTAFITATALLGIGGRSVLVLTIGALIAATAAVLVANWIARASRVGIDAAMAICLALFYGSGVVMLNAISHSSLPERGGIADYVFGSASTLTRADLTAISGFAATALAVTALLWKEFKLLTFDPVLCRTMGLSNRALSPLLLGTVTVAIVIGIKAVGLILMVAFAIMPAAAARQWTRHLWSMIALAGLIGALSAAMGSYLAVSLGSIPTGPIIVLVLAAVLAVSLLAAPRRSLLRRRQAQRALRRRLLAEVAAAREGSGPTTTAPAPAPGEAHR
ncbi:metal ABC transporter permease [Actinomyces bowdenii]|uniref:metal ABC transporter permease n=1 Tax=Actinomyces bowdenii TaxID=131109 RepID=UPI001ABCC887|nr:metal ABC transporter permease [Actinomyces bowdenii]MBO3725072.1 metal ABC transporter permease [Actinomyces bowdenii]